MSQSTNNNNVVSISEGSIRSIVGWQQQRFQHLQTLSQGLLSILLALTTISVTLYSVFGSAIPPLFESLDNKQQIANGLPVTPSIVELTLLINILLLASLAIALFSVLLSYLSGVFAILTENPPKSHYPSDRIVIPGDNLSSDILGSTPATDVFHMDIVSNSEKIEKAEKNFIWSVRRLFFCLIIAALLSNIYFFISDGDMISLLYLNTGISFLSLLVVVSFFQDSAWNQLEFNIYETISIVAAVILCALVPLLWAKHLFL